MSRHSRRSERPAPGGGGGTNFDPLVSASSDQVTERTLSVNIHTPQRSLLAFVEGVAQAALKARNEFLVRHLPQRVLCAKARVIPQLW